MTVNKSANRENLNLYKHKHDNPVLYLRLIFYINIIIIGSEEFIESFKQIEEYPDYYIGNNGTIKSYKKGRGHILKPWLDSAGRYYMISLCNNNKNKKFLIHRLVAKAFVDNPFNKPVINHKDHNTRNNNYTNLEWCTTQENIHHSYSIMPPARNKRPCILISPDGEQKQFDSYADVQRYRDQNNLPFGKYALNYYGHSAGYRLIKL